MIFGKAYRTRVHPQIDELHILRHVIPVDRLAHIDYRQAQSEQGTIHVAEQGNNHSLGATTVKRRN